VRGDAVRDALAFSREKGWAITVSAIFYLHILWTCARGSQSRMKRLIKVLRLFGVVGLFATTTVIAQVTNVFNFDEFGGGQILTNGVFAASFQSTLAPDPTGGLLNWNVLIYTLPFQGVQGDVLVRDPAVRGDPILDVLRFDGKSDLIVYSDDTTGFQTPADTPGMPNPLYTDQLFLDKQHVSPILAFAEFTPSVDDPGYDSSDPTYLFFDPGVVPEPGGGPLLLSGLGVFGLAQAWQRFASRDKQTRA